MNTLTVKKNSNVPSGRRCWKKIANVKAWMGIGNASADAMYQIIGGGNPLTGNYNYGSTAGNLFFSNPFVSSLSGAINDPNGNFLKVWGRGAWGDMIGNISMPGKLGFGLRLGMEGFVMPLFGNLTSDVTTGKIREDVENEK